MSHMGQKTVPCPKMAPNKTHHHGARSYSPLSQYVRRRE